MFLDAHTHTQFAAFEKDYRQIIKRALEAGVAIINVGTQQDTSARAVEVAHEFEKNVYAAVGLHPVHTQKSFHDKQELGGGEAAKAFTSRGEDFNYDFYHKLASDPKVVAIGECGLDYYRVIANNANEAGNNANVIMKERQRQIFLQQAHLALELHKPLMIHCRPSKGTDDAYEDLFSLLSGFEFQRLPKILHFYVGSEQMTKKFVSTGYYFTFGGVITFARNYDEQIKLIPLDRLFLETDAPYVAPEPYRGKRNEPAYIIETAKKMAELKNVSYNEIAKQTSENASRIFGMKL